VTAWQAAGEPVLEIPPELAAEVGARQFMATYLWHSDTATARGSDTLGLLAADDARWSGVYLAVPAPDGDASNECCFTVHFPALVDGRPMGWLHAQAGWYRDGRAAFDPNFTWTDGEGEPVDLAHLEDVASAPDTIIPHAPEPVAFDPDLEARSAALLATAMGLPPDLPWHPYNLATLALADIGIDSPNMMIYLLPGTTDPDLILVSGWLVYTADLQTGELWGPSWLGSAPLVFSRSDLASDELELEAILVDSPSIEVPSEAHIFATLAYDVSMMVGTEEGLWRIEGGVVEYLARR